MTCFERMAPSLNRRKTPSKVHKSLAPVQMIRNWILFEMSIDALNRLPMIEVNQSYPDWLVCVMSMRTGALSQ